MFLNVQYCNLGNIDTSLFVPYTYNKSREYWHKGGRIQNMLPYGRTVNSKNYKTWTAVIDIKTCLDCRRKHGTIYSLEQSVVPKPPLHPHCRCLIEYLRALDAGTATRDGKNGADWGLKHEGKLPGYYIAYDDAIKSGWVKKKGNLHQVLPNRMITRGEYRNKNGHLPSAPGRKWFEADINYIQGKRGADRVVFSNDGLIFVTYDHYETFFEIE